MCYSSVFTRWLTLFLLSIGLMWSYWSTKQTNLTLCVCYTDVVFEGSELDLSMFLLNYLGLDTCLLLFWSGQSLSDLVLINNRPLKVHISIFSSCCINNSLTYLLSITHPKIYFRHGGAKLFDICKGLYWYFLPVYLCTCWI